MKSFCPSVGLAALALGIALGSPLICAGAADFGNTIPFDTKTITLLKKAQADVEKALPLVQEVIQPFDPARLTAASLRDRELASKNAALQADAIALLERGWQTYEPLVRQGLADPKHEFINGTVNILISIHMRLGHFRKALHYTEEAATLMEQTYGRNDPKTLEAASKFGDIYWWLMDFEGAESLYSAIIGALAKTLPPSDETVVAISKKLSFVRVVHYLVDESLRQEALGDSTTLPAGTELLSKRILREHGGSSNLVSMISLQILGRISHYRGDRLAALQYANQYAGVAEVLLSDVFPFLSERQRLEFQRVYLSSISFNLAGTLEDPALLARSVLRRKGIVLDSMLGYRRLVSDDLNPLNTAKVEHLRSLLQQRRELDVQRPTNALDLVLGEWNRKATALRDQIQRLEGELAEGSQSFSRTRLAQETSPEQVQRALPANGVLAEFIRYRHYVNDTRSENRYGVLLIANHGDPKWVSLGSATNIETHVHVYQEVLRTNRPPSNNKVEEALQSLWKSAWQPVESELPAGTKTVVISPDGELSFVSFAVLWKTNHFLGEDYSFRYLSSGRDLLAKPIGKTAGELVIFAAPAYDAKVADGKPDSLIGLERIRSEVEHLRGAGALTALSFKNLPGTLNEARRIVEGTTNDPRILSVVIRTNNAATEAALKLIKRPFVLHFAAHGAFLPDTFAGKGNPMLRGLLALAGANTTVEAWRRGEIPDPDFDGILMAEEAGMMDLNGTWLVTLSACDTGLGAARTGEGVLGLRRAFVMAGAQNLMMTLWPVDDAQTTEFMVEFYKKALENGTLPERVDLPTLLAELQRERLRKWRTRDVWYAAQSFGPFVMSSVGK